jgi:hypothetical protein
LSVRKYTLGILAVIAALLLVFICSFSVFEYINPAAFCAAIAVALAGIVWFKKTTRT